MATGIPLTSHPSGPLHRVSTWLLSQASALFPQTKWLWDQILCSFSIHIFLGSSWPLANCSKYHTRRFFAFRISRCQLIHPAHHGNLSKCSSMKSEECLPPRKLRQSQQTLEWSRKNLSILLPGATKLWLCNEWYYDLFCPSPLLGKCLGFWASTDITLGAGWTRSSLPVEHLLSMCEVPRFHF